MLDMILQHATKLFVIFFLAVYFLILVCDARRSKRLSIPHCIAPLVTTDQYYLCLAWISLFFAAYYLFGDNSTILHVIGFLVFLTSFSYMMMYRGAIENGSRRH